MQELGKKRVENWGNEDKGLLRQLIADSAQILENKSTKTNINILKAKEWTNLTNRFKEISGKNRSQQELKLAWKRMKLAAKSHLSAHRREVLKTGGGIKPSSPSPADLEVMAITPLDFVMEPTDYDSDAVVLTPLPPNVEASSSQSIQDEAKLETMPEHDVQVKQNPAVKKKNSSKNRSTEISDLIVESNINFKKRQLEMLEKEHEFNLQIAKLKIKKLELEIVEIINRTNKSTNIVKK